VSDDAEVEIDQAVEWIGRERGENAALSFLEAVYGAFQLLARHPEAGRRRADLLTDVRAFPVHSYLVIYREHASHVSISRVIHQKRDLKKALKKSPER
jgi:toxin ParE1/3/4